ncbi:hypothetical protein M0L20_28670 [Spirosoma sp. RP8]|uniref:Restriction endonuclease n=1 Tax=Spirosoma liriopis TaxID=2937440 RepID=A0ABT0HUK2_9BACT|nr:hypothetical protein [Spirosoma liriopis]MCK8495874.1 hypothetical protein [Spirosoma liriopis]
MDNKDEPRPNDTPGDYPALNVSPKTGEEPFLQNGQPLPIRLLDFWRWSASDLASNALRGRLAEYIVAQVLGIRATVRVEWDAYDLLTSRGIRVEVKSAAYLQSWYHKKLSAIKFSIRPTLGWNAGLNAYETELKRQADVYVFCLLAHRDKATLDPLNLDQWVFYVLATPVLSKACGSQKTITLTRLQQLGALRVPLEELAAVLDRIAFTQNEPGSAHSAE